LAHYNAAVLEKNLSYTNADVTRTLKRREKKRPKATVFCSREKVCVLAVVTIYGRNVFRQLEIRQITLAD